MLKSLSKRFNSKTVNALSRAKAYHQITQRYFSFYKIKAISLLADHQFCVLPNPWNSSPLPVNQVETQRHYVLLIAQQQAMQHALLKHILANEDLNSRVKGIAAYEEYERWLKQFKASSPSHWTSADFEQATDEMAKSIAKIFDRHPALQHYYVEAQRKISEETLGVLQQLEQQQLTLDYRLIKRIQHCWLLYRFVNGFPA